MLGFLVVAIVKVPNGSGASQVALLVKNWHYWQGTEETQVQPLGGEDPLEEGMVTPSSILAWRKPEQPGGLQSIGSQRVGHD